MSARTEDTDFKAHGQIADWSLFDSAGQRKYLNAAERRAFLKAASACNVETRLFCRVLHDTGCRISEALALTPRHVDRSAKVLVFECLKKRRTGVYRAVPCSPALIAELTSLLSAKELGERVWPWSRMTAYRYIKTVMGDAGIVGIQANARGLRHGFGVAALEANIPLNLVQRWLGHANITTTAIYANAVGAEERKIASRLWKS